MAETRIGQYTLHAIDAGRFALDGGAMFGIVPKILWSRSNPPDNENRIELAMRCLLLKGDDRVILIDTGGGNKYSSKQRSIYKFDDPMAALIESLRAVGVEREEVSDVILTHLHFDHAGGTTIYRDGELELTFPSARHYVQREQWKHAQNPSERDRGSYIAEDFSILHKHGVLELVDGSGELFSGVEILVTHGHTPAQQLPVISDGTNTLLFCGDLVPTASHIPVPYIMSYDLKPMDTLSEKKLHLERAYKENWILFFEHDPIIQAGKLGKTEKGFVLCESLWI